MRTPQQRMQDAYRGKWYAPTPLEQLQECGATINPDAVKQALEEVLAMWREKERRAA